MRQRDICKFRDDFKMLGGPKSLVNVAGPAA
jgi:hypothetical protein